MSGSGGVLVHVFTSFRHLLLRNRVSIEDLLLGSGIGFIHFKGGHTYLGTVLSKIENMHFTL
jgi:hypothetical protein